MLVTRLTSMKGRKFMKVCAVRDRAVDSFGQPIFVRAIGEAMRSFMDELNREGSPMGAHPEDYDLYHIGDFDDQTGLLIACTPVKMLAVGKDVKNIPS